MSIIKCKMCGGDITLNEEKTYGTCDCCGSQMTFPKISDENKLALFNRGNAFRRAGEFDKALALYENIVRQDDTDAEAHWCCALCRFGIEYVEDPTTFEYIPTCHRASFDSFLDDVDYLAAVENADGVTKRQYQRDAVKISDVQKGILATSQNEEPFDVFICYKETDDATGQRTKDSIDAQEIYYQLTNEGYRVFFSRITLEDKVGAEYEPYIFAALNSAKVMVVIGSKPEYFNAVWVKNEWSRFLAIMRKDRSKLLLPCYKNMDPYDLPEQLSILQSYDMTKIGFIQDLIRGIKKVTAVDEPKAVVKETVVVNNTANSNVTPLLVRAFMFLEDGKWAEADEYCEKVLDAEPKNAQAYLGKLMAELKVKDKDKLKDAEQPFDNNDNCIKASRFDNAIAEKLKEDNKFICERNELKRKNETYDSATLIMLTDNYDCYISAVKKFESIIDWKDSRDKIAECKKKIEEIRIAKEKAEGERKQIEEEARITTEKAQAKKKKLIAIIAPIVAITVVFLIVLNTIILPASNYKKALAAVDARDQMQTLSYCIKAKGYKDTDDIMRELLAETISAGDSHTVGIKSDGTVVAVGHNSYGQCDVQQWKDIVSVSAGYSHTVGLKTDGTVVTAGSNSVGKCNVSEWTDIVAVSAGEYHTVGLKADGTVVAVGSNGSGQCDVSNWKDIVAISAGYNHTIGLKANGTVVATGDNDNNQCDVSDWVDIVAVSAGCYFTVGLKADDTVVAVGSNNYNQCDISDWTNIVAISAGYSHTAGLKADGTVVAVGNNSNGKCVVSDWTDATMLSAGNYNTVGIKSDGTVIAKGWNYYGQCNISDWTNIKVNTNK